MTTWRGHLLSVVPVAFGAVALGFHPVMALPLVAGVLVPELDAVSTDTHRSWLLHTLLFPALLYFVGARVGMFEGIPALFDTVNFLALGVTLHLLADFVYPREMDHAGAEWPVRPTVRSDHTGLVFMGISWTVQWLFYIAPVFIPWLFGVR